MGLLTPNVVAGLALFAAILFFVGAWLRTQRRMLNVGIALALLFLAAVSFFKGR